MNVLARFLSGLASLLWPLLVIGLVVHLRRQLAALLDAVAEKIRSASELKLWSVEIKGVAFTQFRDVARRDNHYAYRAASEEEYRERDAIYEDSHSLLVVHTLKPSRDPDFVGGHRVFDISIFLAAHGEQKEFMTLEKVEYYFGRWYKLEDEHARGTVFAVTDPRDGFAMNVKFWHPTICMAKLFFKDGKTVRQMRYLDLEMGKVYPEPVSRPSIQS